MLSTEALLDLAIHRPIIQLHVVFQVLRRWIESIIDARMDGVSQGIVRPVCVELSGNDPLEQQENPLKGASCGVAKKRRDFFDLYLVIRIDGMFFAE